MERGSVGGEWEERKAGPFCCEGGQEWHVAGWYPWESLQLSLPLSGS